ncbi:MAG: response regulator [Planctomycetota bacterium]|nr:response regulator [Planctomycetota bacterium]
MSTKNQTAASAARPSRVLLVEDNRAEAILLQDGLLHHCPGELLLTWVQTVEEAMGQLATSIPDAVLLDLTLPDSHGFDTVERICQVCPSVPIVVLTGLADEHVAMEAVHRGAQDYLVKGETDSRSIVRAIRYAIYRKQSEDALRRAHDELERKVADRTAALATRSEQLRALASELTLAEQRERRRLARILHDHLQQLLAGASFLLSPLDRAEDAAVRQTAAEVREMIEQSMECSRSLTGELSPPVLEEGDLAAAMEWLGRWMQEKHGLRVDLLADEPLPPQTQDVKVLLFQGVRELLFNVVKHAGAKSARVALQAVGDRIRVVVSDEGEGFDPGQTHPGVSLAGGFGLFSLRERLSLMGGAMEIDSAPRQGSRLTLWTPPAPPRADAEPIVLQPAPPHQPPPARRREGRGIRVILADDHAVVRQGLARLLKEQRGIKVVGEAADGATAVELACRLQPDVVIMDVAMPNLNGIEATRRLRSLAPGVRVIGLSMFEVATQAAAMRQAGAADYLVKSGPSRLLIKAIRSCVSRRGGPSAP